MFPAIICGIFASSFGDIRDSILNNDNLPGINMFVLYDDWSRFSSPDSRIISLGALAMVVSMSSSLLTTNFIYPILLMNSNTISMIYNTDMHH